MSPRLARATDPPLAPGMRHTAQRRAVWEATGRIGPHCSAEQIFADLQRRNPGFSRSTVYRCLDALIRVGAVTTLRLQEGPLVYEVAGAEHQHALCQICRNVLHLEQELVDDIERHLRASHRFQPLRVEVLAVGICDSCARGGGRPASAGGRTIEHSHPGEPGGP